VSEQKSDPCDALLWGVWLGVEPVSATTYLVGSWGWGWWRKGAPARAARRAAKRYAKAQQQEAKRRHEQALASAKALEEFYRNQPKPPPPKSVAEQIADLEDAVTVSLRKLDARVMPLDEKLAVRAQLLEWYLERRSQLP